MADEAALNETFDAMRKNYPDDPDLSDYSSELGKLYAHAAMLHPAEMREEAIRADALLREFSPGGRYADRPAAGWKQIQHADFLSNMGQETAAKMIYRNLANHPMEEVFRKAVADVIANTELTPSEVKFWTEAIEKRLLGINKPAGLKGNLALLRQWNSEATHARRLAIAARVHQKKADFLLSTGQMQQGLKEMQLIKQSLDEYYSLIASGKAPKEMPNSRGGRYLKLSLAMAEAWLDNNRRAVELTNGIVNSLQQVAKEREPSLLAHAKYWQLIAQDRVATVPEPEMQERLYGLLAEGQCGPHLACRLVEKLAQQQEKQGDKAKACAYFRDLANALPDPAAAIWARQKQIALENANPELKQQKTAPTAIASLFMNENSEAEQRQADAVALGTQKGIRALPNWRDPQYKTRLDQKEEDKF